MQLIGECVAWFLMAHAATGVQLILFRTFLGIFSPWCTLLTLLTSDVSTPEESSGNIGKMFGWATLVPTSLQSLFVYFIE